MVNLVFSEKILSELPDLKISPEFGGGLTEFEKYRIWSPTSLITMIPNYDELHTIQTKDQKTSHCHKHEFHDDKVLLNSTSNTVRDFNMTLIWV